MLDTRTRIIGIDPGASGGIAYYLDWQDSSCFPMPKTEEDILEALTLLIGPEQNCIAYIEQVTGYIGGGEVCHVCKQARNQSPGSSMFKFGQNYGMLRGFCVALRVPLLEVPPQLWQKVVGVTKFKGETKTEHKNRMKGKAQQLFPKCTVTLSTADALLLAYYGSLVQRRRMQ